MEKKYTLEEFKVLFDKAVISSMEELEKDMDKNFKKKHKKDELEQLMFKLQFNMQSTLMYSCLRIHLFGNKKESNN